jgi:hypothetical protein
MMGELKVCWKCCLKVLLQSISCMTMILGCRVCRSRQVVRPMILLFHNSKFGKLKLQNPAKKHN